jgi:elongation of very long chain fatty acids protein 6
LLLWQSVNPWIFLFGLSKIPELLDTFFIVLRKRPLIFLHYYHHVLTLLYCWHGIGLQVPNGGWFAAMNLVIHTLMYAYYAACAYGVRFGEITRQSITSLQILQMVLGIVIIVHNLVNCNTHPDNYIFGLLMYISYMVLFVKLYVDSYIVRGRKRTSSGSGRASSHPRKADDQQKADPTRKTKKAD